VVRVSPNPPRRPRLAALFRFGWRATSRVRRPITRVVAPVAAPLAALAPVRVPLALATAPLGRATTQVERPLVALRLGGDDVTPLDLAELTPAPTDRLLVLVPDAGHDERLWSVGSETTGATYAERLQQLLGWTPVSTRLDAGSPTEAGLELASLLQRLVEAWPVPVQRIVVVAAGNGGLVARAACSVRFAAVPTWAGRVSEVVGLGVPRYGVEPARLSSDLGKRIDEHLAGIVVAEPSFLELQPVTWADHLLVTERQPLRPGPLGSLLGGVVWWRHRRGGRPRHVVDLFPDAESFELAPGEPLTNRRDVHDALLRWLA
jgi:hypothetical protein